MREEIPGGDAGSRCVGAGPNLTENPNMKHEAIGRIAPRAGSSVPVKWLTMGDFLITSRSEFRNG